MTTRLRIYHLILINTPKIIKNLIIQISESGTHYFVYLSCILPTEVNFMKFEMSKMLISYLGFRYNDDTFYHSVDIITHDFVIPHFQYSRKIEFEQSYIDEMRIFLLRLHRHFANKTIFENIIKFIHNTNYENGITVRNNTFMTQIIDRCIINRTTLTKYMKKLFNNNFYEIFSVFQQRRALGSQSKASIKQQIEQETASIKQQIEQKTDAKFSTEINKFIDDMDYRMNFNTPLDPKEILYRYIQIPNFNDIYSFMMFLKAYGYVSIDDILLQNMNAIKRIYDNL